VERGVETNDFLMKSHNLNEIDRIRISAPKHFPGVGAVLARPLLYQQSSRVMLKDGFTDDSGSCR
jgi:hypothetical protein